MNKSILILIFVTLASISISYATLGIGSLTTDSPYLIVNAGTDFGTTAISYTKAYWVVDATINSGCSGLVISSCESIFSISGPCSTNNINVSIIGSNLRVVVNTPDGGGYISRYVKMYFSGTGSCVINNFKYARAISGGVVDLTPTSYPTYSAQIKPGICKTAADTDCNNAVSDTELLSYITKWLSSQVSDSLLLSAISAWLGA